MFQNDVSKHYKENSIYTMSPEELTLMLYNGLIKFLMKAESGLAENDYEVANNNLIRSQDIINEFISTLDMKFDISKSMFLMYDYMRWRLIQANLEKNSEIVTEVMGYAKELRDSWQIAMKEARASQSYQKMKSAK